MFPSSALRLRHNASRARRRTIATLNASHGLGDDFALYLNVFNEEEQKILLGASLSKLDRAEDRQHRKRRKIFEATHAEKLSEHPTVKSMFLPDHHYDFQKGHYDGVINNYREMHVSTWPKDQPRLSELLNRLRQFHSEEPIQYHVLHLASDGEIHPHVDHLEAFGSWIVSVSLGSDRILRLEKEAPDRELVHNVILPSGSVYVQKDSVRYEWKHSILCNGSVNGKEIKGGQRLSIMIRNRQPALPF